MPARPALCLLLLLTPLAATAAEWPELAGPSTPQGGGENDAALILGVEDYAYVADIPGAAQNARDWYQHLTRTRKVPASRVKLLLDAEVTDTSMRSAAKAAAEAVKPGGTLWLVFIGHGAPAEDGTDGVLIGADAQQTVESLYARSVRQKELLELLARGPQARTVAIVDACFSGKAGTGGTLVAGLQPLLPVKSAALSVAKTTLLAAGAANQFAGPLPGAARPAFSYLVLGALRGWGDTDGDGKVTATEAVTYARESMDTVVKGRRQTPELAAGDGAGVLATGAKERGPDLVAFVLEHRPKEEPAVPEVRTTGPAVKGTSITTVVGDLTVDAKPREGVRLELTDPSGTSFAKAPPYKNDAAMIGRWRVTAKAEGYADETQAFEVPPDETTVAKLTLKRLGALKVTGTPVGSAVKVTGPGFAPEPSGLPWEATGLRSGMYRVEVSRPGYELYTKDVPVESGATASVVVELRKQAPASAPAAATPAATPAAGPVAAPGSAPAGLPAGGTGGCPAGMAFVAGGRYVLGDAKTATKVKGFCLDVTEVTVAAYAAIAAVPTTVEWAGLSDANRTTGSVYCNGGHPDRQDHPVNCVDWNQAEAFCRAVGKRLPAEAEWEWAARGGEKAWVYPWGNAVPTNQLCWQGDGNDLGRNNRKTTCRVGALPAGASPGGIHDLAGNVWEWTSTPGGWGRVSRGGGWTSANPSDHRAVARRTGEAGVRDNLVGFRCAMSR